MNTLPEPVQTKINEYLDGIKFTIVNPRKTALGMWRYRAGQHEITINSDLTSIQFMLTTVHEIAHVRVWELYKNTVKPHGQEWKDQYRQLMLPLLQGYFDFTTENILKKHMLNPPASARCTEELKRLIEPGTKLLSDVCVGCSFKINDGREFVKVRKRRVKWECLNTDGKIYLIPETIKVFF